MQCKINKQTKSFGYRCMRCQTFIMTFIRININNQCNFDSSNFFRCWIVDEIHHLTNADTIIRIVSLYSVVVLQCEPSMHQIPIFAFGPTFHRLVPLQQQSHNRWRQIHRDSRKTYFIRMKWKKNNKNSVENYVRFYKSGHFYSPNPGYFAKFSKYWLQIGSA